MAETILLAAIVALVVAAIMAFAMATDMREAREQGRTVLSLREALFGTGR